MGKSGENLPQKPERKERFSGRWRRGHFFVENGGKYKGYFADFGRIIVAKKPLVWYDIDCNYVLLEVCLLAIPGALFGRSKTMNESQTPIQQTEEREIDVVRLLQILWKRAWIIALVTVVFCVATYLYSALFITPTYRSDFTAYVDNQMTTAENNGSTTTSDLNASIGLTYLYEDIIVSRSVLNDAAAKCGLDYSYKKVRGRVSTSVAEDAALITVYVVAKDPQEAMDLAKAIAEVAPDHVARMKEGSSMRILDEPVLPEQKFAPNNTKNAMLGALVGFVLSAVVVLAVDLLNDIVRNSEELENRYNVIVVGSIPDLAATDRNQDSYGYGYGKVVKKR